MMEMKPGDVEGILDAVDKLEEKCTDGYAYAEDDIAEVLIFRFDGVCFKATEDPDDGYRSSMKSLETLPDGYNMKNTFAPCEVVARVATEYDNDTTQLFDKHTGLLVLEVGTANTDDYYPYFVGLFNPLAMKINQRSL